MSPNLLAAAFDRLPGECVLCRLPSGRPRDLCLVCERDLPWQFDPCRRCGLGREAPASTPDRTVTGLGPGRMRSACLDCAPGLRRFERVVTPLHHLGEAAWLAGQQKRARGRISARVLAELLADAVLVAYEGQPLPDALVPIPLHPLRQLRRGFNQAEFLATRLAARLRLPVATKTLRRVLNTPGQRGASRSSRRRAMHNAFAPQAQIEGSVALIDDVLTTGATGVAAARALSAAGARAIHLWTATRAG